MKGNYTPLIGSRVSQQMNLVTVHQENIQQVTTDTQNLTLNQVIEELGDVFKGQGCMEGKLHLEIDEIVTPVINPPRRVPFALKDKLKSELDRLEGIQIIRKVKEPTEWLSSLVVVEKPSGKLRICIDPVHLNKALKRSHYPLPVILATFFSIIFDSAFKFEIGLKFLNCKKSASGFLSRGDNTADFKHVGMQPSRRERLTMLVIVGSNRSVHCLMIEDGNGSKLQDFENTVAASSLMSSSFSSVKVENLVEDMVSTSSITHSAESIRAFF